MATLRSLKVERTTGFARIYLWLQELGSFKEEKMKAKHICLYRVVDDDIESSYKIVPDIFDFVIKL